DSHTSKFLHEKLLCGPLLANRTVVLVAHHVELVLPGANYLVRMLDGRIDAQGPIQDLRAQELKEAVDAAGGLEVFDDAPKSPLEETKKPRKLVKDEHCGTGGVKWSMYSLGEHNEGSGILP
ncbi:hypothetical protein K443DRAFT_682475, partial [Laccaria amethystina LaAM-08-1]